MVFKRKFSILLFILSVISITAVAQSVTTADDVQNNNQQEYQSAPVQPAHLDKKKWEALKKDLKINEPKPEKKIETKEKPKTQKEHKPFHINPKVLAVLKWTSFILMITLLLLFVLKILGINPFRKKSDRNNLQFSLEEIEDNLDKIQLDPYIEEALKNKDYRLAIRLYYLMIIQRLAFKDKIIWKKYKTNKHYLNEMRSADSFKEFSNLTRDYERIWFSEMFFQKNEYEFFQPKFVQYLHSIR